MEPIPFENIYDDLEKQGAVEIVVFARTEDGNVLVYGSHGGEATDELIFDGNEEWEALLEVDDE